LKLLQMISITKAVIAIHEAGIPNFRNLLSEFFVIYFFTPRSFFLKVDILDLLF